MRTSLLDPKILERLGGMVLRVRSRVEGTLWGIHRSPHHGQSVEFREHKAYAPGDDLRHLDWKAFGKFDKYYVKRFEEETELWAYLLLDCSGSMGYAREGAPSKLAYASRLVAGLTYLLLRQGDRVGLTLFAHDRREEVPPRSRAGHLAEILRVLEEARAEGTTDLSVALAHVSERVKRRSLIVLFSDLFDGSPDVPLLLRRLRARGHEVAVFQILDPDEVEFPFEGPVMFESLESSSRVLCDTQAIRSAYLKEMQRFLETTERACVEADIEYHRVLTATPLEQSFGNVVQQHERRVRGKGQ